MLVIVRICLALALTVCCTPGPAAAAPSVGIVLMHGLNGVPLGVDSGNGRVIGGDLITGLRKAGYSVEAPEMCWSHRRIYDHDVGADAIVQWMRALVAAQPS